MSKRSSKKVLEKCFQLATEWAAAPSSINLAPLMDALKEYDPDKFFEYFMIGAERLAAKIRMEREQRKVMKS